MSETAALHPRPLRRITILLVLLNLVIIAPLGAQTLAQALTPAPLVSIVDSANLVRPAPPTPVAPEPPQPEPAPAPAPAPTPAPVVPKPAVSTASTSGTVSPTAQVRTITAPAPAPATATGTIAAAAPSVEMTVTMLTTLANTGTDAVRRGEVTVPLMALPQSANQVILSEKITPAPLEVTSDTLGNRAARFDLTGITPGSSLVIRQEYRLRVWGAGGTGEIGPVVPQHLAPQPKIESDASEITAIAATIARAGGSVEDKLSRAFAHTRELLRYDSASPARNQGALMALANGSGVCEEYASLFVALARAMDIPARMVTGWGRDLSTARQAWGNGSELRGYRHAWAEAYLPDLGWVTFDPTHNRAGVALPGVKSLGAGTLITDNYGDRSITGKYVGGKLQVTRSQHMSW